MSDFSNLTCLNIDGDAAVEYFFYGISGEPSLLVRPATRDNKGFFNKVLSVNKQSQRKLKGRQSKAPTIDSVDEAMLADIEMFVEHIVVGWNNVMDAKGKSVKFSKEVCREFLQAIPADMFDELRLFCLKSRNFREEMDSEELEELSGN